MKLTIELGRQDDGRWLAAVPALSDAATYGETPGEALRHLAARIETEALDRLWADASWRAEVAEAIDASDRGEVVELDLEAIRRRRDTA